MGRKAREEGERRGGKEGMEKGAAWEAVPDGEAPLLMRRQSHPRRAGTTPHNYHPKPPPNPTIAPSCADQLLRNLYRWISSPASRMYDPPLQQTVKSLMQKLLLQLVAELKRLGASVPYADASVLVVCTGKTSLGAGLG